MRSRRAVLGAGAIVLAIGLPGIRVTDARGTSLQLDRARNYYCAVCTTCLYVSPVYERYDRAEDAARVHVNANVGHACHVFGDSRPPAGP